MTTRQQVATAAGAVALAVGGFAAASATDLVPLSATETTTVAVSTPACTAVTSRGEIADPCTSLTVMWEESNRNALGTMAYYPKWKAANPNEYAMLRSWGTSVSATPDPTARTAFGALVRYHLGICRMWAVDLSRCLLP